MDAKDFMRRAIELSRREMLAKGERPFGSVVVKGDEIVGEGCADQLSTNDPTGHAEMNAIRAAAKRLQSNDLSECEIYTSCEPCPMCTAAIWYTGIRTTYYANLRTDFAVLGRDTNSVVEQTCAPIEKRMRPHVRMLEDEAKKVLDEWKALPQFTVAMSRRS